MSGITVLLQNPLRIERHRDELFHLRANPYRLNKAEHKHIWPYMSNVWSISKPAQLQNTMETGIATSYYQCRFYRKPDAPSSSRTSNHNTSRRNHAVTACYCRMSVREHVHEDVVEYTMSLESHELAHTHTLDDSDMFKLNDAVKNAVFAELAKGYSAKDVANAFLSKGREGAYGRLEVAGGKHLSRRLIQSWKQSMKDSEHSIANPRRSRPNDTWENELHQAQDHCFLGGLRSRVFISKNQAGEEVPGIVWAKESRLRILALRGYLTLFDSTHKTNKEEWKLFTWMVRSEVNIYIPCAGALIDGEDGNAIGEAMRTVRLWLRELQLEWNIRYCLTDDSAAEQRAVRIAFPENDNDFSSPYGKVEHLFCKWHSKQTLDRQLHGDLLAQANEHLKAALFNRRTEAGCLESIQLALDSIPDGTMIKRKGKDWNPKQYIQREWLATREHWANYNREKEYILMQIGTTGANEGWHNALKTALKLTKNMNSHWSLKGVIQTFEDCARVVDNRYEKGLAEWGRKELSLTFHYPWLKLFPFPAQVILADNLKAAELRQMEESRPIKSLNNTSECDCKDFRRWNLHANTC